MGDIVGSTDIIGDRPYWLVFFQVECESRWLSWLAMGRFKHVLAMRPVGVDWLVYDVSRRQTTVCLLPGDSEVVGKFMDYSVVVKMPVRVDRGRVLRLFFWCVPAVAHLLGLRTCAVRPDALFRHCMKNGGEILHGQLVWSVKGGKVCDGRAATGRERAEVNC